MKPGPTPTTFRWKGRLVSFRTLSERFGLAYKLLWRRYRIGDRGDRLVRPVESKYGHRGQWGSNENHPQSS